MKSQSKNKWFFFIILGILFRISLPAAEKTLLYREKAGDSIIYHYYTISSTEDGWIYNLKKKENNRTVTIVFILDSSLSTIKWTYDNPDKNIKFQGIRENGIIRFSGNEQNKSVEKTFEVGALPWKQIFSIDMELFALSGEKEMEFWAVGAEGPGAKKIAKFSAKYQDRETVSVNGKSVEAIHIQCSLTGLKSMLWKGDYWFRVSDGLFVLYKGGRGPGTSDSITELIEENNE
ncbi:MAG: hypothetical protein JXB26_02725 [Candidatus Aminicenantes bacterium]|nr:hypothetical protein [Candidatus Aminicenantes bacterium]